MLEVWLSNVPEHTITFTMSMIISSMISMNCVGLTSIFYAIGEIKQYLLRLGTILVFWVFVAYGVMKLGLFFASSYFTVFFPEANWHAGGNVIPGGFFIFLLGSFVVGASATILQVVINPYLTACHVKGTQAIQRLAIGGSANSVGTTLAPYFVTGVVFGGLAMEDIRIDQLMIPFLVLIVVISLIVFLLMKLSLPEMHNSFQWHTD